ncbi:fimbrial protein [Pseudomonas xanthosomatis]|uniref:fimbrial protein n=1 Tax=Pseudomonas xanthosomatis TaxID=2842356 RepID=UPI003461919D
MNDNARGIKMVRDLCAAVTGIFACLCFPVMAWGCDFPPGYFYEVSVDPGNVFVPRDALPGAVIKEVYLDYGVSPVQVSCPSGLQMMITSPLPQIHGSPLVGPGEVILETRIPGVGVVLGSTVTPPDRQNEFTPHAGRWGWAVPHVETTKLGGSGYPYINLVRYYYRIIKTGPIDPAMGTQSLAGHLLAEYTERVGGKVITLSFTAGSVTVAQCGLPGSPGSQISVPMGTWRTGQFRGEGSHTDARMFMVPVNACTASQNPADRHFAHLRLDPRNGSSVLDAQRGILGLNSDSDATGVGVQVLKADLTPMPLTEEVQMTRLQNGDIQIPMAARYIQVGKDTPVGGVANASVGFTLTYK